MQEHKTRGSVAEPLPKIGVAETHPSLARLHERAAGLGWRCLSDSWSGYHAPYVFECPSGHRFDRHATMVLYRQTNCLECEAVAIRERWMATVAQRGGALVSGAFTGLLERYRLRCANGHEWETQGRKISEGSWCHHCQREETAQRNLKADGLQRLHGFAQARGGRCLAEDYTGGRTYYRFECAKGHQWEAQGAEIVRGTWCRKCVIADDLGPRATETHFYRDGLERLQDAARRHGGECLATEYIGSNERYRFRCAAGHEWMQKASQIWFGHWCGQCVKTAQRTSIESLRELAASRGGQCLSEKTEKRGVKLTWACHLGHVWQTTPATIKQGAWCPNCVNLERSKKRSKRKRWDVEG